MSRRAYWTLLVLACLQLMGALCNLPRVKGFAMATTASPLPRVFTVNDGLEAFSSRYELLLRDAHGAHQRLEMNEAIQARMRGPYNRRNAYGAVFAYGPVLQGNPQTRGMFLSVARHALCGRAPLLRELGLDPASLQGPHALRQRPRPGTRTNLPLSLEVPCS